MKKINYYKTFEDDFVQSENQDYVLPDNYKWIHNNIFYRIISNILYVVAYIFGFLYCKFILKITIKNKKVLKKYKKQGIFIYGNHTQPIADVFIPALICKSKRIYVIANPSNLKVKFIGKVLPMIGVLPIPPKKSHMKELIIAVHQRYKENNAIITYPEAHVSPYYTKIRPFPKTAFKFAVENNAPVFCTTTTYQKRKEGKKPKITIFVDGPFFVDEKLNKKENQEKLHSCVYNKMQERSANSNYEYIEYKKQ